MQPNEYTNLFNEPITQSEKIDLPAQQSGEFTLIPRGEGPFREKYRPQKLNEIVPTCSKQQLENIVARKTTSQVFLLEGITGTGKTTSARILAKAFICQGRGNKPCLTCEFCQSFEGNYDVTTLNAADKNKVEDMRALAEEFRYKPMIYPFKIYILDEVQRLTEAAQQVLLTELEEPPTYLLVFLCTTDSKELLKPLADRATRVVFGDLKASHAGDIIRQVCRYEGIKVTDDQVIALYNQCKGSVRALLNNIQALGAGGFDPDNWQDDDVPPEVSELFKLITSGSWPELSRMLAKPGIRSKAENLRFSLESYFRGAILNADLDKAVKLGEGMRRLAGSNFAEANVHQYNQFVLKCLQACNVFRPH